MSNLNIPPRLTPLACLISLTFGAAMTTHAQTNETDKKATLKEIVVSASRSEQATDDLPLTIDVISAQEIEAGQMGDIRDVAKNLPNISVKRAPARFSITGKGNAVGADSNAGFSIRGQGGNRVVMLVDGVRLPRSYINGSNAFGRDSVDLGLLKQIEIVRGPTSALYGSDGLAGLVNFITLAPADFLIDTHGDKKAMGGKAWLSYSGDDQGVSAGGTVARRAGDNAEWSLTATTRHAQGMNNMGTNDAHNVDRTTPNPQSIEGESLLGKLVLRPMAGQQHVLSFEHVRKNSNTDLFSSSLKSPVALTSASSSTAAAVIGEKSDAATTRNRLTLDSRYLLDATLADYLTTVLSLQNVIAQQNGQTSLATNLGNDGLRIRKTSYQERAMQVNIQADKAMNLSQQWAQKISYGVDYASTDVSSFADGSDPTPLVAFIPKKYFPDTRDSSRAIYIQSELMNGDWSMTPGVRLDQFSMDVLNQTGYFPGIAKAPGKSMSGSAVSPKMGVLYRATPQWSLYGNYASGFRAPEGQQVNSALEVSTAKLLPNPDLKPEESRNIELGFRTRLDSFSLDMAVFSGKYTHLIVEKKDLGTINGLAASLSNPTLFQTVNIDSATISGFELKGNMVWGQVLGGQLSTPFSYGQTRGSNDTTNLPLNYIDPAKLTAGLKYETPVWNLRLDVNHQTEKKVEELDNVNIPKSTTLRQFIIPAATTLDFSSQWRFKKNARLNFGISNLTNQKYWNWSDVQGLASNTTPSLVDAYTQPGRHVNVSFVADF